MRRLALYENPVNGEVVVGVSTGVVELLPNETAVGFKQRGDKMMYDKKAYRKESGLRRDRHEVPELVGAESSEKVTFGAN